MTEVVMKGFTKKETEQLLKDCKNAKISGKSLTNVFKNFSKNSGRAFGSVRNYYYKTVKGCDESLLEKLGITSELKPAFIKAFSEEETKSVVKEILIAKTNGVPVRKTVYALALGNDCLALRYQNKYRNALKFNKQMVLEIVEQIKMEKGSCFNPYELFKSEDVKTIENEINDLINKIYVHQSKENTALKRRLNELSDENRRLKNIIKNTLQKNNVTKEYFSKLYSDNKKINC